MTQRLFYDMDGNEYTDKTLEHTLRYIGAHECETLFIHSDVMFGKPVEVLKRKEYLGLLLRIISDLGVKNIIVPTFTYSFCNNEVYDVAKSRTYMGSFNEYIRKLDDRFRTYDPLLSISVPKSLESKFYNLSNHSLGAGCALDIIHNMEDVKFLFLGADLAECFTYVHYVEKTMEVPYRFDMTFEGNIIFPDGSYDKRKQTIFTQCGGVRLPVRYDYFEADLKEKGFLKNKRFADKSISCISEKDAYKEIKRHIEEDAFYYVSEPFNASDLTHNYTYDPKLGKITHC